MSRGSALPNQIGSNERLSMSGSEGVNRAESYRQRKEDPESFPRI